MFPAVQPTGARIPSNRTLSLSHQPRTIEATPNSDDHGDAFMEDSIGADCGVWGSGESVVILLLFVEPPDEFPPRKSGDFSPFDGCFSMCFQCALWRRHYVAWLLAALRLIFRTVTHRRIFSNLGVIVS